MKLFVFATGVAAGLLLATNDEVRVGVQRLISLGTAKLDEMGISTVGYGTSQPAFDARGWEQGREAAQAALEAKLAGLDRDGSFRVELNAVGPNKIPVIHVVRELTGLGLKEAKDIVDGVPLHLVSGVGFEQARHFAQALVEQGADVDVLVMPS